MLEIMALPYQHRRKQKFIIWQKFRERKDVLKKRIHEIFSVRGNFFFSLRRVGKYCKMRTVRKSEKFSLTDKKFREISFLVISLGKSFTFSKFLPKKCKREFLQFPHWAVTRSSITIFTEKSTFYPWYQRLY